MMTAVADGFVAVRNVANERFAEVLHNLAHISTLEPMPGEMASIELRILRGLFFVHLYGAMEKSLNELILTALCEIKSKRPKNKDFIHPFNVISLSRSWKGLKDSGYKDVFEKMACFFAKINSEDFHEFDETLFSGELQNIWAKVIEHVFMAFGITTFQLTTAQRVLIDEVVEKRNAVAHGRENAASVGERYQTDALKKKLQDIQQLVHSIINELDLYCKNKNYLILDSRSLY